MNSSRIYLTKEEQIFLMEMLEEKDPLSASEKFAELMVREGANPMELEKYLKQVMINFEKKYGV